MLLHASVPPNKKRLTASLTISHAGKIKEISNKKIWIGDLHEFTEHVQKFTIFDFDCMFRKAGLQLQKGHGDYELEQYDRGTLPRLILLAKKPA